MAAYMAHLMSRMRSSARFAFFCASSMARMKSGMLAAFFGEEEHVQAQCYNVKGMETRRVLFKVFKEVMRKYFVEEREAILEFVDVHLLHHGADELFAAVLSRFPNSVVFGASFVDGFGLFYFHHCRIFGNLVTPAEAKALRDGKCGTIVVGHVGRLYLNNPYNIMKPVSPVVGDGLQNVEELFLQGKKVVIIWLANDGWLGVQSILKELCNIQW